MTLGPAAQHPEEYEKEPKTQTWYPIAADPNSTKHLGMCQNKSNPWRPHLATTGLKRSTANTLVPDTTGHPQKFCCYSSMNQTPVWSMDWTCSCTSQRWSTELRTGETGGPWALFHIPQVNSFCCVAGRIVLLGWVVPLGNDICPKGVYLHFKYLGRGCQDLSFSSKTFYCNKMINVIHLTCQCNIVAV